MAVGETGSGKTTALKLIHQLLGGSFMCQSTNESVISELVKSSFPVYWDDPAKPYLLQKALSASFQGAGKQTKGRGSEIPITTFLTTVNFSLNEDLRYNFIMLE